MISEIYIWNLMGGLVLALTASLVAAEAKSSSLIPKSLLLWPALVLLFGILNLIQGWGSNEFLLRSVLGAVFVICGIQALAVNLRRIAPWPSGVAWLGLVGVGLGLQLEPRFMDHVMGFIWIAIGIAKVARERSASLEAGTPFWILLVYAQAILLASYRS